MGDIVHIKIPGRKPDAEGPMSFTIAFEEIGSKEWSIKVQDYYKQAPPQVVYHEVALRLFDIAAGMLQVGRTEHTDPIPNEIVIASVVLFSDGSAKIASLPADTKGKAKMLKTMMKMALKEMLEP